MPDFTELDNLFTDNSDKANALSKYFASVYKTPTSNDFNFNCRSKKMSMFSIDHIIIKKYHEKLPLKLSTGPDEIPSICVMNEKSDLKR
jgi:restriction endonuclease S subunit